ncbi:hypothetical protein FSU_2319 [Fibrobacter succinogenes subsp. succinogenes S85]|uniref:Uncharacterized protein n=1 Tax=Fibrobacter succinogenes (strain ATCC 19169 / S85) TaxID=59374 RepID=D9S479_FIBSS|nr:hypothetical protein FSU_2319 [Fibrobacter succinogenes subsp. succinogenes S85]
MVGKFPKIVKIFVLPSDVYALCKITIFLYDFCKKNTL